MQHNGAIFRYIHHLAETAERHICDKSKECISEWSVLFGMWREESHSVDNKKKRVRWQGQSSITLHVSYWHFRYYHYWRIQVMVNLKLNSYAWDEWNHVEGSGRFNLCRSVLLKINPSKAILFQCPRMRTWSRWRSAGSTASSASGKRSPCWSLCCENASKVCVLGLPNMSSEQK